MTRLEYQLNQLWHADDWRKRHRGFRKRLRQEPGAVKAFDGLITAGCYADVIVAGVTEIAQSRTRLSPAVRRQGRRQAALGPGTRGFGRRECHSRRAVAIHLSSYVSE